MLLKIILMALGCSGFLFCAQKKKVLILSINVGAGHTIAAQAVIEHLHPYFECKTINMIEAVTEPFDPLYTFSGGSMSSAKVISSLSQKNWNRTINFFQKYCANPLFFKPRWKKFEEHSYKIFQEENPDLIISVVPALNYPFAEAAKRLNKPFILSVLDADYTMWMKGVERIKYDKFKLIIPFKISNKMHTVTYVPENVRHQTVEWGIPLRKAFTTSFNKKSFKKKWHFADNKPNILLMMGGQSSQAVLRYVKGLCALKRDYHVFVFIGSHASLGEDVKKLVATSKRVTFEVVSFTQDIPFFMQTADLLISKAGGLTCAEVQTAQIKTLFDATYTPLFWEGSNMHQVIKSGHGRSLRTMNQLGNALDKCLKNPKSRDKSFRDKELFFSKRMIALARTLTH